MKFHVAWNPSNKSFDIEELEDETRLTVIACAERVQMQDVEFCATSNGEVAVCGQIMALWGVQLDPALSNKQVMALGVGKPWKPFDAHDEIRERVGKGGSFFNVRTQRDTDVAARAELSEGRVFAGAE